jgi:gliding motility-associated-like protein
MRGFLIVILTVFTFSLWATHNRAGEITYTHVSGLTYEFTVVTYTKESAVADRPLLEVQWGDGTLDSIPRVQMISLGNDIQKNVYVYQHTYPGADVYTVMVDDPNRNSDVINIPGSVNIPFHIETILTISPFLGENNSPQILNPPIDNACVGVPFIHNPGAYDPDGDSLVYLISESKSTGGSQIPGYSYPAASNSITVNAVTGDLIWDSPLQIGEYNVAIIIQEYRNGIKIGEILRDMQITVAACSHTPPVISKINDTCIIAGDTLQLSITAQDNDPTVPAQVVTLTATGGPLQLNNSPAVFTAPSPQNTITGLFYWETVCAHVQKNPYQVFFKAVDNGSPNLVDFFTLGITVIAPKPENLTATPQGNSIILNWDPEVCNNAVCYKIYRHDGLSGWNPSYCETGVPAYTGFYLIGQVNGVNNTTFVDNNNGAGLATGNSYCYRVVACFSDGAESIASDEVCATLKKDVAIITNVSVNNTDINNGSIYLAWSKPTEHDTIAYASPYHYLIYRGTTLNNLLLIDSTLSINDTMYVDTLINTVDNQFFYRIDFYSLGNGYQLVGKSTVASSIYLTSVPNDNQLELFWTENVPWTNSQYIIYRQNPITLNFDSIGHSYTQYYLDDSLANGNTYCYKIKSIGSYTMPGIVSPLINYSQEKCAVPEDKTPPCSPPMQITADCDKYQNTISWRNPNTICTDDVVGYKLYKKDSLQQAEYVLIASFNSSTDTVFTDAELYTSIAGCYYVTAIDSFGNESAFIDSVCADNCPVYELPNVFTPGNDGFNDMFKPFPYRFVDKIELYIYNRWGQVVFKTTNPDVLWDGTNTETGTPCTDGTYFYVCKVFERYYDGIHIREIKNTLQLIREKQSKNTQ